MISDTFPLIAGILLGATLTTLWKLYAMFCIPTVYQNSLARAFRAILVIAMMTGFLVGGVSVYVALGGRFKFMDGANASMVWAIYLAVVGLISLLALHAKRLIEESH